MSKEPGQMAYEAWANVIGDTTPWRSDQTGAWAAVESAIRADERAKVIEECAKVAEDLIEQRRGLSLSFDMIAAALRATLSKHKEQK